MKISQIIFLIPIIIGLNSCFLADQIYTEQKKPKISLKQKTQNVIVAQIKKNSEGFSYNKYGFSELIIYKPKELVELDVLKEHRKNKRVDQIELEVDIKVLEQEIEEENIKYSLEMDHTYSLTDNETKEVKLYEARFFISDSLKVVGTKQLILLDLDSIDEIAFSNYFYETAIFEEGDYYLSKKSSRGFYQFFKNRQEELTKLDEKSEFMKHTLWLCNQVRLYGGFEQEAILEKMVVNRFKTNKDVVGYKMLIFSTLYEINNDKTFKGYYFFHKFSHSYNRKEQLSVVYIRFSPYYEIKEILEVKKPYKQYFDE